MDSGLDPSGRPGMTKEKPSLVGAAGPPSPTLRRHSGARAARARNPRPPVLIIKTGVAQSHATRISVLRIAAPIWRHRDPPSQPRLSAAARGLDAPARPEYICLVF